MVAFAAHTPELLAVADRVVVLEAGRVVSRRGRGEASQGSCALLGSQLCGYRQLGATGDSWAPLRCGPVTSEP